MKTEVIYSIAASVNKREDALNIKAGISMKRLQNYIKKARLMPRDTSCKNRYVPIKDNKPYK